MENKRNTEWAEDLLKEVELSNIRKSSNDDVEYAVEVIDKLVDRLRIFEYRHIEGCLCSTCE